VWLRASPEEHMGRVLGQGDRRPMEDRPRAMEELRAILAAREPSYSLCELSVETDARSVEELVKEIRTRLEL
jgi:XRE family aerobic/anaerobic benzoate catabolism transcriptional regulator